MPTARETQDEQECLVSLLHLRTFGHRYPKRSLGESEARHLQGTGRASPDWKGNPGVTRETLFPIVIAIATLECPK